MSKTISVIIPVYNVASYLSECLESVLSQDYENLEVILIDDGSTDESGKICDEYAQKDSRICVIHQENCGAGAAKNAGLRAATGEYLCFLDSDDYLEPGAYSHMVELMEHYDADVVQCVLRYVFQDRTEDKIVQTGRNVYDVVSYMALYPEDWTCALMTEKLFKRQLFHNIFFEEGNAIDDEYFTYQGVMNAKTIVRDDRVVYNYRQRLSSVMNSAESRVRVILNSLDYLEKRRQNISVRFPELKRTFDINYLEDLVHMTRRPYNTEQTIELIKDKIYAYLREKNRPAPGIRFLPKLLYVCFADTKRLMTRRDSPDVSITAEMLYK